MDLSALPDISAARVDSEISMRIAKKTLDATKAEGEAAVALIQAAVDAGEQMNKGGTVRAIGSDGHVDVTA